MSHQALLYYVAYTITKLAVSIAETDFQWAQCIAHVIASEQVICMLLIILVCMECMAVAHGITIMCYSLAFLYLPKWHTCSMSVVVKLPLGSTIHVGTGKSLLNCNNTQQEDACSLHALLESYLNTVSINHVMYS